MNIVSYSKCSNSKAGDEVSDDVDPDGESSVVYDGPHKKYVDVYIPMEHPIEPPMHPPTNPPTHPQMHPPTHPPTSDIIQAALQGNLRPKMRNEHKTLC